MILSCSLNEAVLTTTVSCGGHNFIPNGGFISTVNTTLNFTFKVPYIVKYMPIIVQQDVSIYSLFIPVNRSTCFWWYFYPLSGAHVTVSTASGISKTVTANCRERDWTGPAVQSRSRQFAVTVLLMPDTVDTVT